MLKKISFLVVVILSTLFLVKPAHAATLNWEPMVNSLFPASDAHRSPGFDDTNNILAISMVTFADYVYVANLTITTGTEIWRSNNGTNWEQVNEDGFSDPSAISFAILAVFDGHLYAFNYLTLDDHVDVYRYNSGTSWEHTAEMTIGNAQAARVDPYAAVVYNNTLYVSLVNDTDNKSAIYESTDGTTWTASNIDGFGGNNGDVYAMAVYNNCLYAGTYNIGGAEVWKYDGSTWVQDNIVSGFDGAENSSVSALTSFGGALYASTDNSTTGVEVWKSLGGVNDWTRVSDAGFNKGTEVAASYGSMVFKGKLYIGTANAAQVFRSSDGTSWEQVNVDHFGYSDNIYAMFAVLGDYLYAGTGNLSGLDRFDPGDFAQETTEIYRYYEPSATTLPETGFNSPLHAYILDALL